MELPVVDLVEQPAFPLPAHLESADIAAGKVSFDEVFDAERDLFHTAFNGLDGGGVAVLPNSVAINRFSLLPEGSLLPPNSQSCGGCHNFPFPGATGVAQTHVFNDPDVDGKPPPLNPLIDSPQRQK